MKSYTDLEQSKKLAEILGFESADMYYKYVLPKSDRIIYTPEIGNPVESLKWYNEGYTFRGKREPITLSEYCIPCWSLATLLGVLPKDIIYDRKIVSLEFHVWENSLEYVNNADYTLYVTESYNNPVDACVEMILKLHELKIL